MSRRKPKSANKTTDWNKLLDQFSAEDRYRMVYTMRRTLKKRKGSSAQHNGRKVNRMKEPELCAVYRKLNIQLAGSALEATAREICLAAYQQNEVAEHTRAEMSTKLCDAMRTQELFPHRKRKGAFNLNGISSEEDVAAKVVSTRLVDLVGEQLFHEPDLVHSARSQLTRHTRCLPEVKAVSNLLYALHDVRMPTRKIVERICRRDAAKIANYLRGNEFSQRVAEELIRNPVYGREFERSIELKLRVRERIPETPQEAYPLARTLQRHFVLHVGPTNSGKTHEALNCLAAADSGVYLGPLRLLAYEQFERLNNEGCPCSLLTGEEATEVAGARHVSSTVEMANFHKEIDVAVIDEAQMISDPERGQHWTAAILGIPAKEIHVCCAPHAENIVRALVELCEDELEVVAHKRLVPLRYDTEGFEFPQDIHPGDALIVFSRRSVHAVADIVSAIGLRPSLIYGALPHDVRHEEARRFLQGETNVVVSTDAIGMGMNLPIRRIVFVEQDKFDGVSKRTLNAEEVRQIAGRAGRFGIYNEGLYQSTRHRGTIRKLYSTPVAPIKQISVGIPRNIALVRDATLTDSILQWTAIEQPSPFVRVDVSRELGLIGEIESLLEDEHQRDVDTKLTILTLATMPFDEGDSWLHGVWRKMVRAELLGDTFVIHMPKDEDEHDLKRLEEDYRFCDLCYTYARAFNHREHMPELVSARDRISRTIMQILATSH